VGVEGTDGTTTSHLESSPTFDSPQIVCWRLAVSGA
jgi:hypothetical protein